MIQKVQLQNIKVFQKYGLLALKISIILGAWWYVFYKITSMPHDALLIYNNPNFSYYTIVFVIILMVANWILEARKWQYLAQKIQPISLYTSIRAVCAGMPLALVTPNRVGEIGGRSIVLQNHKKKTMLATLLGSIIQLVTTIMFGIVGFFLYIVFAKPTGIINNAGYVASIVFVISIILYFVIMQSHSITRIIKKILGRHTFVSIIKTYRMYSYTDKLIVLLYSIARYIIFSGQFMILTHMLIPEMSYIELCTSVFLTYFFTTAIPTSVMGEIGIRGSVAMVVFGMFTTHVITVFQISMLLWVINIAIPTAWGSYILLSYKK
ncbi:MAG TPA: hypothetical protein PLS12_08835 [Bacteroidales bacterium]|jgi:hypothetical protein|nr:hypothetical protein [Bacteroidales bacterium]